MEGLLSTGPTASSLSDRRLPCLDVDLFCLDGVGMKRVSQAVRYLDKPQWRAVKYGLARRQNSQTMYY